MKKIISVVLAILIVVSSITTVLLTSASAATNLWTDPMSGFESSNAACKMSYVAGGDSYASGPCYMVDAPYWRSFSFKLPSNLSASKVYSLSFEYLALPNNANALADYYIKSMYLAKDGAAYGDKYMPSKTMLESTASNKKWTTVEQKFTGTEGELRWLVKDLGTVWRVYFRNFSVTEVPSYNISAENGVSTVDGASVTSASSGATVTLTANPPAGKAFERWEVVSGGITIADENAPTTTFTMPDEAVSVKAICKTNLWDDPTEGFIGSADRLTPSYITSDAYVQDPCYKVPNSYWSNFAFKLPSNLSADKSYRVSFEYSFFPESSSPAAGSDKINGMYLATRNSGTGAYTAFGDKFIASATKVELGWETVTYEFTGAAEQLYLYVNTQYIFNSYFRNFSLIELESFAVDVTGGSASVKRARTGETVTLTADVPLGKQFKKWEVVSGGVTLANENANPTTFVIDKKDVSVKAVFEKCQNLWTGLGADNFLKLSGSPTFSVNDGVVTENSPWYTKFRIEMPELEKNVVYRLSFDHKIKLDASKVGKEKAIARVQLMTEAQLQAALDYQAANPGTSLDIGSQGKKIVGATDTTGDWESTISYEFDSGANTVYYVAIATNHAVEAQFRNFKLEKIAINMAPQFDANLGSVTPVAQLAEVGNELTFTATPFKGNTFEGWYKADGQTLLSKEQKIDYLVDDSFEAPVAKFAAGTPAVENASLENSSGMLVDVNDTTKELIVNDPLYDLQSASGLSWQEIKIEQNYARTGSKSLWIYTRYSFAGRTFKNLEKNTDYAISCWLYGAKNSKLSVASYVLPAGVDPIQDKKEVAAANALGRGKSAAPGEAWQEVIVNFNSGDNTEVVLWLNATGEGDFLFVDDFAIYRPAVLNVIAGLGGDVTATDTGSLAKGTEVTLTATPYAGNNFKHWVDGTGAVLSTDTTLKVTVNSDLQITALFEGYNMPGREVFAMRGQDGTFENGTISGWQGVSRENGGPVAWCTWQRSKDLAYEGDYSLKTYTLYQNSVLPLAGLNTNTNYKFSFYVNYPEYKGMEDENHKGPDGEFVDSRALPFGILAADDTHYNGTVSEVRYASHPYSMPCGGGWYEVELYFNTGDATAVNFVYAYYGVTGANPVVYFDNISLFEYQSVTSLTNTDLSAGIAPWLGSATAENGAMKLAETDATAYQTVNFGTHKQYNVSFRAKGKVFAAAADVAAKVPSVLNALSSKSYVETDSADWQEYSFTFYTGAQPDVNIMFASKEGTAFVDDITVTEAVTPVGAVVETIDFETERFALSKQNSAYEIYTATGTSDANVHSGKASLRFKADAAGDVVSLLDEAYLSYGVLANVNYRLTLYYKLDGNGTVSIAPNRPAYYSTIYGIEKYGAYCEEDGYEYSGSGWNKVQFTFTAEETHVVKTMISDILGKTDCDFYLDDITVTIAPDSVVDPDPTDLFCEAFFNLLPNAGFEDEVGKDNWLGLPKNAKVVQDKASADTGKRYLSLAAGEKYILPIPLEAGSVYYFAASLRGNGRVALATQVDPGEAYFVDVTQNDRPASILTAVGTTDWMRSGFSFRANASGVTYLVIEAINGQLDVDTLSLCLEDFTYTVDPNRYEAPVKFDYDNIDPALLVYNGGFDDYEKAETSPETGDSVAMLLIVLTTCLAAAVTLVFSRRKEVRA